MTDRDCFVEQSLELPDPAMSSFELDILRTMNGEDVPGLVAGAAMWSAAAWLKGRGYAEGHYQISDKGRAYLEALKARVTPEGMRKPLEDMETGR